MMGTMTMTMTMATMTTMKMMMMTTMMMTAMMIMMAIMLYLFPLLGVLPLSMSVVAARKLTTCALKVSSYTDLVVLQARRSRAAQTGWQVLRDAAQVSADERGRATTDSQGHVCCSHQTKPGWLWHRFAISWCHSLQPRCVCHPGRTQSRHRCANGICASAMRAVARESVSLLRRLSGDDGDDDDDDDDGDAMTVMMIGGDGDDADDDGDEANP